MDAPLVTLEEVIVEIREHVATSEAIIDGLTRELGAALRKVANLQDQLDYQNEQTRRWRECAARLTKG